MADARRAGSRPGALLAIVGGAIGLLFAAPLLYLVVRALGADTGWSVMTSDTVLGPLGRSLLLALLVTVLAAGLGTTMAWLVVRTDLPGRRVIAVLAALPLVLPSFVAALAAVAAFASGGLVSETLGVDTNVDVRGLGASVAVLGLISYPYVYLPVLARLLTLPRSLEESAQSLGASPGRVFRTVIWPQLSGSVIAGSLLVFLYVVSDFGAVSLLQYDTLTRRIYATRLLDPDVSRVMSLVLALIALVVVAAEHGVRARRRDTLAARGTPAPRTRLGAARIPACGFVGVVLGFGLVAPLAVLTTWAVRGVLGGRSVLGQQTDVGSLVGPTLTTAALGVGAALSAVAVVLPIAILTRRYRSRVGGLANALVIGGFALPGIVIALSLVSSTLDLPLLDALYQTVPLLIVAYVIHFGAQAMRTAQVSVEAVPTQLGEAARSLGAGTWRRFRTVDLPLMAPGLAAGGGLVLLAVMKELPATLLLAPIGVETLATRIWSAAEESFFAQAGVAAIMLVALSALLTWMLTLRNMERVG